MPLKIEQKKAIVAELSDVISSSISVVVADYRGLNVSAMTDLRSKARKAGVFVKVTRNTLTRRAVEGTDFESLGKVLSGPVILFFSKEEPGAAARIVRSFVKDNEQLEVKGLMVGSELLAADQLKRVADLPTREQALSSLMYVMKAPITQLARVTSETYAKLVRVISAVGDKKK